MRAVRFLNKLTRHSGTPKRENANETAYLVRRLGHLSESRLPFLSMTTPSCFYAALPGALASSTFSPPTLTLICFGLASAFLASLIFSTPWL